MARIARMTGGQSSLHVGHLPVGARKGTEDDSGGFGGQKRQSESPDGAREALMRDAFESASGARRASNFLQPVLPEGADVVPTSAAAPPAVELTEAERALAQRMNDNVLAGTGLAGKGEAIVSAAKQHGIPVELLLAQLQIESGMMGPHARRAIANNNPGNLRWAPWEAEYGGERGGAGTFTRFPSVEQGISALAGRISMSDAARRGDWAAYVRVYAPNSDGNDEAGYVRMLTSLMSRYRSRLGLGI